MGPHSHEVVSASDVLLNFKLIPRPLLAHTHAATGHVVNPRKVELHFGSFGRICDGLTADNQLRRGVAALKLAFEGLCPGAHDLTHRRLERAETV